MATEIFLSPGGTCIKKEALAGGAGIYPGSVVLRSGSGVIVNATADSTSDKIAIADLDRTGVKGVDTAYASGDLVFFRRPFRGEIVNLILAASQTITAGAELATATNGQVKAPAVAGTAVRFVALEAVTTTGSTAFIKAEVL